MNPYYLYIIPALILLGWAFMIHTKKNPLKVHHLASDTLLAIAGMGIFFTMYYVPSLHDCLWVDFGFTFCAAFLPASYYVTIRELTGARGIRPVDHLMLILPATFTVLYIIFAIFATPEDVEAYIGMMRTMRVPDMLTPMAIFGLVINILFLTAVPLSILAVIIWAIKRKRRCVRMLREYYVNINRESGDKITTAIAFDVIQLPVLTFLVFVPLSWAQSTVTIYLIVGFCSFVAFASGKYFYNLRFSASELKRQLMVTANTGDQQEVIDEIREIMGEISEGEDFEIMPESIFNRIKNDGLFLEHGLNLMILADKLGISRKLLAHSIHYRMGVTLSAYIRSLRIDYAVQLIESSQVPKNMKVKELASMVGYSDARMFSDDLREKTGMSPHSYLGR